MSKKYKQNTLLLLGSRYGADVMSITITARINKLHGHERAQKLGGRRAQWSRRRKNSALPVRHRLSSSYFSFSFLQRFRPDKALAYRRDASGAHQHLEQPDYPH